MAWKEAQIPRLDQGWLEVKKCAFIRHLCIRSLGCQGREQEATESREESKAAQPKPGPTGEGIPGEPLPPRPQSLML